MDLTQVSDHDPATTRSQPRAAAHSLLGGFAHGAFDELPVAVLFFVGPSLIDANAEWTTISGLPVRDSTGNGWLSAVHSDDREDAAACLAFGAADTTSEADFRLVSEGGSDCWYRAIGRSVDATGAASGPMGLVTLTPVGIHRSTEARLLYTATHDALTGLASSAKFMSSVERSLGGHSHPAALLFIDLDHFKVINDQLGHSFGDAVLQAVCRRVEAAIRSTDLAGRLGGDEIGVFCARTGSVAEVVALAEHVGASLAAPFTVAGQTVIVDSSIGIAFTGPTVRTAQQLIDAADRAMYTAKSAGGGRWAIASDRTPAAGGDGDGHDNSNDGPAERRPGELNLVLAGRIAVEQAIGMIAQRSGADPSDSAAMLRTYASANAVSVVSAARMVVERGIDIDTVATVATVATVERHPSPADEGARPITAHSSQRASNEGLAPLHTIYADHCAAVYGCAKFICGEEAASVTEYAFETFWQHRDDVDTSFAGVRIHLLTIAHRLAMHAALSQVRTLDDDSGREFALSSSVGAVLARGQVIERTLACAHLDATERSMAALLVHGRCSSAEIARVLGEPEEDVKLLLRATLRHLRDGSNPPS